MKPAKTLSPTQEAELISKMKDFGDLALEGNMQSFTRMTRCEDFKVGKQWDSDVVGYNKSHNKITLTINRCLPTVNHVCGQQIQNPRDVSVKPLRRASAGIAKVKSAIVKDCLDATTAQRSMEEAFDQGITTGRGWFGFIISFQDDIQNGDIEVRFYDAFTVLPDPSCLTYDINDPRGGARFLRLDEWIDKAQIDGEYPKKKGELADSDMSIASQSGAGIFGRIMGYMMGRDTPSDVRDSYRTVNDFDDDGQVIDKSKSCYRVSTVYWKDYVKGGYLIRKDMPLERLPLTGKALKLARQAIEDNPNVEAEIIETRSDGTPVIIPVMNRTMHVGSVILEHREDIFNGVALFPMVRFAPYYRAGYEYGIVENLIGPQEQVNWSWSMECNIIKQLANTGWKIANDIGGRLKQFLQDHGSEDGIVLSEQEAGGKIEKLEPTSFPAGYDVLTEKGSRHIQEIANVRLENPEFDRRNMSGRAIALKQQSSFTGSAPLFSRWDRTLEIFAKTLVAVLDANPVYSDDEIREILDESDLIGAQELQEAKIQIGQIMASQGLAIPMEGPQMPMPQRIMSMAPAMRAQEEEDFRNEVQAFQQTQAMLEQMARPMAIQMMMANLRKRYVGRYSTKVTLSPQAETFRMAQAVEVLEMHKILVGTGQPGISRRKLIEISDLPDKEELIADVPQAIMPQKPVAGAA